MMLIVLLLLTIVTIFGLIVRFPNKPAVKRAQDSSAIGLLLSPPGVPIPQLLLARSLPNARLIHYLGIGNTFVNPSPTVHREFVYQASSMLGKAAPGGDWRCFGIHVADVVDHFMPNEGGEATNFATFMQGVTFSVILVSLFDVELTNLNPIDVMYCTHGINDLWRSSKSSSPPPSQSLRNINRHLRRWVPFSEKNPLDIIIPSYETMWRVVASTIAHVFNDPQSTTVFETYLSAPTTINYRAPLLDRNGAQYSIECVIWEILRLYPPTKRLSRTTCRPVFAPFISTMLRCPISSLRRVAQAWVSHNTRAGDVEALHRSKTIWGPTADEFMPERHVGGIPSTGRAEVCLMPFGFGPLKCIAQGWAPRAVALVVASIVCREDLELTRGAMIGGREGWNDWFVRRRGVQTFRSKLEVRETEPDQKLGTHCGLEQPAV